MKLKEKIAEQAAEHVRLTEENEKLRKENLITVNFTINRTVWWKW